MMNIVNFYVSVPCANEQYLWNQNWCATGSEQRVLQNAYTFYLYNSFCRYGKHNLSVYLRLKQANESEQFFFLQN